MIEGINTRATELDRMMHNYSNMLEQSLPQAEVRAKSGDGDAGARFRGQIADRSQGTGTLARRGPVAYVARHFRAETSFASLSEQVANQLSGFTNSFNETTQQVRSSTHQAANELEQTQSELKRQAKALPEATKQSAKAMRRALQDQLSALDSLTEITSRHGYSGQISKPEAPRSSRNRRVAHAAPHAATAAAARDPAICRPLAAGRRDTPPPLPVAAIARNGARRRTRSKR